MSVEQQLVAERYRLASLIGSGGMGRVWLARDEVLRRDVAVKEVVLPEHMTFAERNELCQRTLREARAAGRLSHPNVVAVYDVVQAEGRPWIVMELVRSRSLYQVVKEDGPIPPRRAAEIGLAVLDALRAAHKAGVWHRDVKPGNVLLADDGRVVLTDFGLATFEGDGTVTRSGVILGSAQYISPERARDGASGPESDLWSLGATLYAAVEGRSPYARDTPMATLTALATVPPDTPRRAGPLRPVLIGLLRKNPRHRMRAPEVERLLTKIAAGDARSRRGLLTPRQRALGQVGVEDVSGGVTFTPGSVPGEAAVAAQTPDAPPHADPVADAPGAGSIVGLSGAGPGPGIEVDEPRSPVSPGPAGRGLVGDPPPGTRGRLGRDKLHTRTEETFRHVPARRRAWPFVLAVLAVAIALGVPAYAYIRNQDRARAVPSATPLPALNPAMGVQACRDRTPPDERSIQLAAPTARAALPNWTYYTDESGYTMEVPLGWMMSHGKDMLCLRDPTTLKTISVIDLGAKTGVPLDLVTQTANWERAADLTHFQPGKVTDMLLPDGGAILEYTYERDQLTMHGENYMMRLSGHLFVVGVLTSDGAWPFDRGLLGVAPSSFELVP
jgi:hypothetical protein